MAALASAHVGVVLQEIGSQATLDAASAVLQSDIGERLPPRWCVLERRGLSRPPSLSGELPAAIVLARRTTSLVLFNVR